MDRAVIAPGGHSPTNVASVSDAVARHRSVGVFTDRPVDRGELLDTCDDPLQSCEIR